MEKNKTNKIIAILVLGTFGILSTEMGMVGILPEAAQYFNINIAQAGLFVSMFALIIAISALFMPLLFSKFERKKTFTFVLTIFVIFTILSALTKNFTLALIFRIIPAFVHPVYCGLALTVAAEIVPEEEKQDAVSKVIMGVSAGMIIGVPITTLFANYMGYQAAMLWFTTVNLIALIGTITLFPQLPGQKQSYGSQVSVAKTGIFIASSIGVILLNGALYASYGYISEFLSSMTHIIGIQLTITLFIYGVASIIGNWLGSKLLTKNTNKTVLTFPFIMMILLAILFIVCKQTIPTIIIMALWGLLAGIENDIAQYWIVSAAPQAPEFANGVFLSMGNIGVTIGTTLAGLIVISSGVQYIIILSIVMFILTFIALTIRVQKYATN
ncbi:MFS transporter [Methanosphaera sp. WGK6]|uniref:MFS transporter n=1 Tax=Methanosphaera sp. WGK6 TaxID=1561964 RepID=UPI00084C317E|nr:MFS transporter [Methanosphaera sp. WGK6]OED30404.1 hypothetical protein NL43_03295 [Methanosphaera sp. WGK6]